MRKHEQCRLVVTSASYGSRCLDICYLIGERVSSRSASSLVRQQANQPTSQPLSHPVNQPANQSTSQPTSQPAAQPASRPATQSTSHPANQPYNQLTNQSVSQPALQSASQSASQPTNQPVINSTLFQIKINAFRHWTTSNNQIARLEVKSTYLLHGILKNSTYIHKYCINNIANIEIGYRVRRSLEQAFTHACTHTHTRTCTHACTTSLQRCSASSNWRNISSVQTWYRRLTRANDEYRSTKSWNSQQHVRVRERKQLELQPDIG